MWKFLRDLKIKYKLFFIFALLLILTAESWFFSFTTIRDIDDSFQRLETYAIPSLLVTSELKDDLNFAFSYAQDYASTGNTESKQNFQKNFQEVVSAEIALFELAQTEQDFEFTQLFETQINNINTGLGDFIEKYEKNPEKFNLQKETAQLTILRNSFDKFLEGQITIKVQQQIETASQEINTTVTKINYYLLIVLSFIVLIVLFLFRFVANNITKPVGLLTKAAEKMGQGKFEPVNLKGGDELGLFAQTFNKMGRDITQARKDLEEELTKTKELDEQKTEFLSVAAHQLRTPMSGIKWVFKMILEGDMGQVNKEQEHHISRGLENSERMIKLINSLLDITKMEEQKFQYNISPSNVIEIIESVTDSLVDNAQEKQIKLIFNKPEQELSLNLDKEKIKIALTNLIDNAIKYSPEKTQVEVSIRTEKNNLIIEIKDQGYGIPKSQQNQVFDKFFRGSNILKIETEYETIGTGLGLYITKDIITKHEGEVWFESQEDKGTTFFVKIPLNLKKTTSIGSPTKSKIKKQRNLSPEEIEKIKQKYQK